MGYFYVFWNGWEYWLGFELGERAFFQFNSIRKVLC